jgi:hypothetical protein
MLSLIVSRNGWTRNRNKGKNMVIQLNAFHKDSSAHYSKRIEVANNKEFLDAFAIFEAEVPFSRFYCDNETEEYEDQATLDEWGKSAGIA